MKPNQTLLQLAKRYLDQERGLPWLEQKLAAFKDAFKDRTFFLAFSACPRFVGKEQLELGPGDLAEVEAIYPNFGAISWTKDELARILLMTAVPVEENQRLLDALFGTADYRESIALYKGLYFLKNAADFVLRTREGLRTNMEGVFDAITLHNPYPYRYLPEDAWNQMVLKAVFMNRPIYKIYRIEERKNEKLARIFLDYAHERWSAHRTVSPELWRFVSGFVDESFLPDLQKVVLEGDVIERQAAIRALQESSYPEGQAWLQSQGLDTVDVPGWDKIGQQLELENSTVQ